MAAVNDNIDGEVAGSDEGHAFGTGGPDVVAAGSRKKAPFSHRGIRLVELVLFVLLCILVARLFWLLFAPISVASGPAPVSPTTKAQETAAVVSPFRQIVALQQAPPVEEIIPEDVQETSLDLSLNGVWLDGENSTAIIATPDGKQGIFKIGDEIWDGVTLEEAYPNQVRINRRGIIESIKLPNKTDYSTLEDTPPTTERLPTPVDPVSEAPTILTDIVRFEPTIDFEGQPAFGVYAINGHQTRFEALGLRNGDIIRTVENRRIANIPEILSRINGKETVRVVVERGETPIELEIATGHKENSK